jgi:O-antigen/teichoic acid export membrane protein
MTIDPRPPTTVRRPSRRSYLRPLRRLSWGVADQGVSSISNFALGLFVARTFGAVEFGAFTLAYVTYSVAINAARGLATDPLLVRHSGESRSSWRRAASDAAGTALVIGLVAGAVCLIAGVLLPDPVGAALIALGVALPALTLQDSWRFAFFAAGRGRSAFLNDLLWTVLLIGSLAVMHETGYGTASTSLLLFGGTAAVAAAVASGQAGTLPKPRHAVRWLRAYSDLGPRYMVENVITSGASQIRSMVLGLSAGLAAVGYVRASEILMGPFLVLLMGLSQVAVPEAARVLKQNPRGLMRFCLALGSVQAGAAIVWGLIVILLFPLGAGEAVLKDLWEPTSVLMPIIVVTVVAASFITAATAGLRAMGLARRSLRAQLVASVLYASLGAAGAISGGAVGASCGVALAQVTSAVIWWTQLRRSVKAEYPERRATP